MATKKKTTDTPTPEEVRRVMRHLSRLGAAKGGEGEGREARPGATSRNREEGCKSAMEEGVSRLITSGVAN